MKNLQVPQIENDFGQTPLALGRLTKDQGAIAVLTLAGAFVGTAFAGLPLAALVLAAGLNDILSVNKKTETVQALPEPSPPLPQLPVKEELELSARVVEAPALPMTDGYIEQATQATTKFNAPVYQPAQSGVRGVPRTKEELVKALRRECSPLLSLVKSHPARCVGVQRSGKTTMVKKLGLLRQVLLPSHRVVASTPHYEPSNSYPGSFEVVGITEGGRDYPAIRKEWEGLAQRVEDGQVGSTTTIWDEFGLMDKVMAEDALTSVLTSCLRETMKFGEYPLFVVHGETAAFLPGSKGLVTVFLNGTVRVETLGEKVIGEDGLETIVPTGRFRVQWLDGTREEGKIPDWLTEELLIGMLPQPAPAPVQQPVAAPQDTYPKQSAAITSSKPTVELKVSDALPEPLKTIWLFAKQQDDWVTVREIQRKTFAALKGQTSQEIHQYLGTLANRGYGQIDEEGKSDSAVGFLAN